MEGCSAETGDPYQYYEQRLTTYVRNSVVAEFDPAEDKLIDVLDSVGVLNLIMHIESDCNLVLDPT